MTSNGARVTAPARPPWPRARVAGLALGLGLIALLGIASISSCYDPPQPACGFRCGPGGACPEGYTCADDQRCHRNGTSEVCATFDGPVDEPVADGGDAGDASDAMDASDASDAPDADVPDAPADTPDADAPADAPGDAPDAPGDAP